MDYICVDLWTVSWIFTLDLWTLLSYYHCEHLDLTFVSICGLYHGLLIWIYGLFLTVYHCEHLDLIFVFIYGLFPGLLDWISLGKVHFSDF